MAVGSVGSTPVAAPVTRAKYNHLNPASAQYSGKNAAALAKLSDAAYLEPAEFKKVAASLGFDDARFFTKGSSQAYVAVKGDAVVVAFRGTEGKLGDFIDDAKVRREAFNSGEKDTKVHRGFQDATRDVWAGPEGIAAHLTKLRAANPKRSVLLTGHSLGGAMATIAAAELARAGTPATASYVYGSPIVGNKEFATWFDKTITAFYPHQKQNDFVTRVPSLMNWVPEFSDWVEVGHKNQRYLGGDGSVMVGASRTDKFVDRAFGRIESGIPKVVASWDKVIDGASFEAKAALFAAKKLINMAKPSEAPVDEKKPTWSEIWFTDGLKDHKMVNYVNGTAINNTND